MTAEMYADERMREIINETRDGFFATNPEGIDGGEEGPCIQNCLECPHACEEEG